MWCCKRRKQTADTASKLGVIRSQNGGENEGTLCMIGLIVLSNVVDRRARANVVCIFNPFTVVTCDAGFLSLT